MGVVLIVMVVMAMTRMEVVQGMMTNPAANPCSYDSDQDSSPKHEPAA